MSANTEAFGQLPAAAAPKETPGVFKVAVKACHGLAVGASDGVRCVLYNPSGIEVVRTPFIDGTADPQFPTSQSKATLMFHNAHGFFRIAVVGRASGVPIAGVSLPVAALLGRENGVMTAALGAATATTAAPFEPFREVRGEAPAKDGYVTFQYQFTAGGTCAEPEGTAPAVPVPAAESKSGRRSKTPEVSAGGSKKDRATPAVGGAASPAHLVLADRSAEIAALPPITSRPILRVDAVVAAVPLLADAELYYADMFQFAADPIGDRGNKQPCALFATRTHLYLVAASDSAVALRCVPLSDVTAVLTKGERTCVKCAAQHDFYGETSSTASAKALGVYIADAAPSLGGAPVTVGDLKEVKSHQWAPRDGYALSTAAIPRVGGAGGGGAAADAPSKEKKEKRAKTPVTGEAPAPAAPAETPAPVASQPAPTPAPAAPAAAPAAPPPTAVAAAAPLRKPLSVRERFERFCARYIPDRLPSLDAVLAAHAGEEEALMAQLVSAYGPEPGDEGPAAVDANSPFVARLTRFFARHQPQRMVEAPYLARQHAGREEGLMAGLVFVYGPEPPADGGALPTSAILAGGGHAAGGSSPSHRGVDASPASPSGDSQRLAPFVRLDFPFAQPAPPGAETTYARPLQSAAAMMPSLSFAAVAWVGHVAYHAYGASSETPTISVNVGILTASHFYVGSDFRYSRCIPLRFIERFYLRGKLRAGSTHVRVAAIIKVQAPEPDCYVEFADQREAEQMISLAMRLALVANPHHVIDTAPFESALEPRFSLVLPEGYAPRRVEPLPLLPQYEATMGRYRSRLIALCDAAGPRPSASSSAAAAAPLGSLEDVDRILYMFPHEEERMVAKVAAALGASEGGSGVADDASDVMGPSRPHNALHRLGGSPATLANGPALNASLGGSLFRSTQLSRSGASFPPPFLDRDGPEQTPKGYSFLEPAEVRGGAPTVGRYTVGSPRGADPNAYTTAAATNNASAAHATFSASRGDHSPYTAAPIIAPSRDREASSLPRSVADLLKAQGFSVLSFNRAAREGLAYRSVTAATADGEVMRDVQFKLSQCGADEERFLELIRGWPPAVRGHLDAHMPSPIRTAHAGHDYSGSLQYGAHPSRSTAGVRGAHHWASPHSPVEALEASSHNATPYASASSAYVSARIGASAGSPASPLGQHRSSAAPAASAPSLHITQQHPLWPYL